MLRKKTDLYTKRTVLLCLLLLLGIASLCGCGKKEPVASPTPTLAPTATPTPTPTATPTPSPTPTPPFVERAYENFGRDDIYKIPIEEFTGNWEIMSSRFNGDYALLWITEMSFEAEKELEPDKCILIKPLVDDEQYRITPDFYIRDMALLDDGTVLLADCDSPKIHIYDNKFNEIRTVLPGEKGDARSIGFSTNGMIWTVDEKKFKLEATDLNGDIVGLYEYDPGIRVTNYVGSVDGRECFEAVSNDGEYIHSYIYLDTEKKEVTYRDGYDRELGEEWQINDVPCVYGTSVFNHSDSTWFIHKPGYPGEGVVFPKESVREEIAFYRDGILCGRYSGYSDTDEYILEYRMYDLKNRTFSDTVRRSDFSGCSDIRAEGFVGDDTVVLLTSHENGNKDLLLWITEKGNTPIKYFCDLSKDDLVKCLEQEIKDLKKKYDIVVTPDCTGSERLSASLGDIMSGMDFVNLFMNDKAFTEEFKPEQGRTIHPENMRNNEGAHFTFNPHVFSSFYLLEHGEERRNVFFGYVDALRAGEDRFKCPDEDTANWCGIRLAKYFFPIGYVYASTEYAGGGWANIVYHIPKEEFLEKEREFEDRICEILNDVLEDDYTDFEKTLALYEFITEYCIYDYEMLDHLVEWSDKQSGYRVLEEKKGICWEIACLYRYLLLQCGVDSEESVGVPFDVTEEYHEWNYIAFDGKGYLIDATWGLTADRRPNLAYFMFTDEMRETRDGFDTKSFDIGGNGLYGARKKYSFEAVDMKYSDLWEGTYIAFDQDEKCIFYRAMSGRVKRFYYEK